ncbi:MAG: tetratricopeptide repeat protein [Gemmatimonadota bacterium]|nr:MAG: tetratricopeptide repeat protein [Gemmatimonadota bacterium]
MKRIIYLLGAILVVTSVLQCARFNTYYNAQQYFQQAEQARERSTTSQLSSSEIDLYNKAIKKASKVITFYPKSKLVDDALLLMGKAFYRKGEYSKAQRKFNELISNFPESNLSNEATFWLGRSYFANGDYVKAEKSLSGIVTQKKARTWAAEAQFLLAEMAFLKHRYKYALGEYEKVVKGFPKSSRSAEAQYRIGQCLTLLDSPYEARLAYDQVFSFDPHDTLKLNAMFSVGQSLREEGRYDQAIDVFEELLRDSRNMDYYSAIRLEIAESEAEKGALEAAISEYEKIIEDYPKSESSAEAQYRLGLIYLEILEDFEKAKEHLDSVKMEYAKSQYAEQAQGISRNIEKLTGLYYKLSPPPVDSTVAASIPSLGDQTLVMRSDDAALDELVDSILASVGALEEEAQTGVAFPGQIPGTGLVNLPRSATEAQPGVPVPGQVSGREHVPGTASDTPPATIENQGAAVDTAEVHFKLAEHYLFHFFKADSALKHYRTVLDRYPESDYGAKSAYAIAWITDIILNEATAAQEAYLSTIANFPGTPYDKAARVALGERSTPEQDSSLAQEQFLEAETMFLRGGDVDSLIRAYQKVIDEYPESSYAPKAGYTIGWILEYVVSNPQAAEEVYEKLQNEYGDTEFGGEAKIKLGMVQRAKQQEKQPKRKEKKEKKDVTPEESLNLDDIERELLEEGPIIYTETDVTRN